MGKVLILAEKPSLAKKIAEALDSKMRKKGAFFENEDVIVAHLVGHVLEAKIPKYEWDMEQLPNDYSNLELQVKSDKKSLVSDLIKAINREDVVEITSAGDPDAEGSLLVKELIDYSKITETKNIKLSRMWILSYDKKAISDCFKERYSLEEDAPWYNAAFARTHVDLYVGFNLSPSFTLKEGKSLSIGRVMTPTTNLVRKRELEIENFVSKQYFLIAGTFNKEGLKFDTKYLCSENNNTEKIPAEHISKVRDEKLTDKEFSVSENQTKPKKTNPDYLPNLNDILKSMSKKYKMKAKNVTTDMQFLYENQFCSYPRSEQKFLPPDMADVFEDIFNSYNSTNEFSDMNATFNSTNKRIFDASQSAPHYAITPLAKSEANIESLSVSQRKIFDFIKGQFMMAFMPSYEYEETIILLENKVGAKFKISGKVEKVKGFKKYQASKTKPTKKDKNEVVLPSVSVGEKLELKGFKETEKWTEPPKLLTEGELLSYMENINKIYISETEEEDYVETDEEIFKEKFSLGTPATRSPLLEKLYKDKDKQGKPIIPFLILNKENRIVTTSKARSALEAANKYINIEMTAKFEKQMSLITTGKGDYKEFIADIESFVNDIVEQNKIGYVPKPKAEKAGKDCPQCGKELLKRKTADNREFLNCSGYPSCKYSEWPQDKAGRECPKCNSDLINRKMKDGRKYIACSGYPDCKYVEWPKDKVGRECPKCNSDLINRKMKDGRSFIACDKEDCKYVEWPQETTGEKCPKCDKDLIWRKKKDGSKFTSCSGYPSCDYVDWG